jgi:hypothetical protein
MPSLLYYLHLPRVFYNYLGLAFIFLYLAFNPDFLYFSQQSADLFRRGELPLKVFR